MRRLLLPLVMALLAPLGASAQTPSADPPDVIVDHDGAVDDIVALALLLKSPAVHVRAVTVTPADSYLEPATRATKYALDLLGAHGVTIAQGHAEGTNPFPADWRRSAGDVLNAPAFRAMRAEPSNRLAAEDAPHHLVRLLSGRKPYVILETGPLSNIADALRLDPTIRRNIARIYVMGGAVRVKGNVEQPGHDGSAEWNLYNQPRAAAEVVASGIAITLVPLDATNRVPLSRRFIDVLGARPTIAAQLAAQMMRPAIAQYPGEYYFWDTLTAAVLLDPSLVTLKTLKLKVITEGPSQGRTVEDPDGAPVQVAVDSDPAKVEALFLEVLGR
jgi:purine nucleosidase